MIRRLAAAAAAGVVGGALVFAGTAHATEFPSTNEKNANQEVPGREGQAAPHFRVQQADECGEAVVTFVNDTNSLAVFEIRFDGVTPDGLPDHPAKGARDWSPALLYPETVTLDGRGEEKLTTTLTFEASEYLEIRLALGGERDWDFDWTTVPVEPCPVEEPAPLSASHHLADCGEVAITFTNNTPHTYDADIRVGDQQGVPDADMPAEHNHGVTPDQTIAGGPHQGEPFGLRYTPVLLPPGETVTEVVEVDQDTTVSYRVWRGPENDFYLPWADVVVDACPDDATDDTTDDTAKDATDDATSTGELAATGMALPAMTGAGLLLLLGGGAAMVLARRRALT